MEEDIDDLLDEVESKFCKNTNSLSKTKTNKSSEKCSKSRERQNDSDVNSIIDDICMDDGPAYEPPSLQTEIKESTSHLSRARKCFPVYLGNTQYSTGLSSASAKKCCNNLRCTSCDFQVVAFDNYKWSPQCDYLFFRNNIPDFSKLKVNLLRKDGCKAYACQCSWRSITKLTDIETDNDLKWVCGKHS